MATATETEAPAPRPLHAIAREIRETWGDKMYFGARPYVDAMAELNSITDTLMSEPADGIVRRFLVNAGTWRGDDARRIKAELKGMVDGK